MRAARNTTLSLVDRALLNRPETFLCFRQQINFRRKSVSCTLNYGSVALLDTALYSRKNLWKSLHGIIASAN